jgi:hypothetical protein
MDKEWRNSIYEINDLLGGHKMGKSEKMFILYNIKFKWGNPNVRKSTEVWGVEWRNIPLR